MRKVAGWVAAVIAGAAALLALMHLFISPINPKQEAPEVHVDSACWACHTVSASIAVSDPKEGAR